MLDCHSAEFILSVHALSQLPEEGLPEIAFAGRSNVGKSSLMNTLMGRKDYVKVSGKPGKTQGLNFFCVDKSVHLVDLPGYGYAKVSREMQDRWQSLITAYLEERKSLCCVVVIIDIRHEPKSYDLQLIDWLRQKSIPFLPVYTKADKLSGNQRNHHASILDAGHVLKKDQRIIFSSKTGMGLDLLKHKLTKLVEEKNMF